MPTASTLFFIRTAKRSLDFAVAQRVSAVGGYGQDGEIIFGGHPDGCPSVLMTALDGANATYMSNGSIAIASLRHGKAAQIRINGTLAAEAVVQSLDGLDRLEIVIEAVP